MPTRKRIAHLIVRLDTGGAEKSLYRLIRHTRTCLDHEVLCLGPTSPISADISALGVNVECFDYPRRGPMALWRAWRALRRSRPDVLQGWMYLGNLAASILKLTLPAAALVWNVRNSPERLASERLRTRLAMQLARLPGLGPDYVIYNSHRAVATHASLGYNKKPHGVIPNGIEPDEFAHDAGARRRLRAEYEVTDGPWVGMVCRWHPLKGVADFLQAAAQLKSEYPGLRVLLAGPGMMAENADLAAAVAAADFSMSEIDLLGPLEDTVPVLSALDLLVIASYREGTPNILLEAMACGLNSIATRVGDVPRLLDDSRLAEPGDVGGLKARMRDALETRADPQIAASRLERDRKILTEQYSTALCVQAYLDTYAEVCPA